MGLATVDLYSDLDHVLWTQFAEASTDEDFYTGWLALQGELVAEVTGGLVCLGSPEGDSFAPTAVWSRTPRRLQHLQATAAQVVQKRARMVLPRQADGTSEVAAPEWYEVAYPIEIAGQLWGAVVLEVIPAPVQLQAILRQLFWGAAWLQVWLQRQVPGEDVSRQERLYVVLDVLATVVEHEDFYEAAVAFVTELATRLGCERVSLGFVRGRRVHLSTMSHSAEFGKKTNLTRALEDAMDEAFDQETVIVYAPGLDTAFQLTRTHEELARQHGAGAICSVPLSSNGQIVGVLTLEHLAKDFFDTSTVELCEAIAALAGPVLEVKRRENRRLVAKIADVLWTQLGHLVGPRHTALKLASLGLAGMITFFTLADADYRVAATTFIEARTQRVAVAPFDGYIADAHVRAGDLVQTGDVLCTLDDRDLRLERRKWDSQKEQSVKQYRLAMAQGNAAQAKIIMAQIAQVEAELALLDDRLARTQVRAPFDGVVVTGDLIQSIGAPVERGQVLFEIAPLDTYRIVLQVDERDTAEIKAGQHGNVVLSAFPSEPLPFTVEKITPVSIAREGRNYFRVEAQLEHTAAHLRPGMEGVGKIDIERRLLLWNWTHRAIDWLRLFVWSWWP